jgi:uncharacterized membrane protein YkgB
VKFEAWDEAIILWLRNISIPAARGVLFIIFFWFGILKIIGVSPAGPLVMSLYNQTIPFIPFDLFYISFSVFECLIGILFLFPKATRLAIPLLLFHMVTTMTPLALLPESVWSALFVPTLEGQYILKNLALIALAIGIAADIAPLAHKRRAGI